MPGHESESPSNQHMSLPPQTEAQLELFKRFVESSGQAFGMADLKGRIIFVNPILCRMMGEKNPEDVYGLDLFVCYPPKTVHRLKEEILPFVLQQGQWVGELNFIDKQGNIIPTIENIFLIRDDRGDPLCFATVITDISQRLRMEQELCTYRDHLEYLVSQRTAELEKSNALLSAQIEERRRVEQKLSRLKSILDNTSDLVGASYPDGLGLYMNAAGRRMVGLGPDEDLSGFNMSSVHPAWAWRIVKKEGIPAAIAKGSWMGETAIVSRDGTEIPVSQVIIAHRSLDGELEYLSTIMRDITDRKQAEQILRDSEAHIREIIDNAPFGAHTYKLEDDGRLIFMGGNPSADRILNLDHSSLIGMRIEDAFPNLMTEIPERYRKVARTGKGWSKDITTYEHKNITGAFAVFAFQTGRRRMTVFFYDITDRKRAEEALQMSEAKYRLLHSSMRDAFVRVDLDGRIREFNEAYTEMLGYAPEELEKLTYNDITPGRWHEPEARIHEEQTLTRGYSDIFEKEYIRQDGTVFPVELRATLLRDEKGKPYGMWSTVRDITERKRTEQTLEESLDILAKAERIGKTGSWKRDLATNDIVWSAGTHRIFAFPLNEKITFEQFRSRIHPDDVDDLMKKLQDTAEKGTPHIAEFRIILPDGTIRHISGGAEATFDEDGRPILLHGIVQDITERKMLEDELIKAQRLDSIGILVGGLAHDYNNLLTAIVGNIDLAKMNISKTDQADTFLAKAEEAAMKARDLSSRLITFSRGGHPIIRIMPVLDLVKHSVGFALSGSDTKAEFTIADNLPEVKIDENQIRQVIHNIVINAREAMPQGGTLSVEMDKTCISPGNTLFLAQGTYVRLAFKDKGRGIGEENLPRIFDPYFTTKDMGNTKGMGLGLSICYSIIKRHGGSIIVESRKGSGTTVTIYIPAAADH